MKAKTLKALKASIKHWERMRERPPRSVPSADSCPLCKLFCNDDTSYDNMCVGCPVFAHTTAKGCQNTPYYGACSAFKQQRSQPENWRLAATAEINFLKSLLPK